MKPTLEDLSIRDLTSVAKKIATSKGLSIKAMFEDRHMPAPAARAEFYQHLRDVGWSYPSIARFVGKDHSSIMYSLKTRQKGETAT